MAESVYLISEAAKEVCVENHVLRYWEEELSLPVKRNAQGHRYYTVEDVNTFKRIKHLKEQGLQLKAIKLFLAKDGRLIACRPKEESAGENEGKSIEESRKGSRGGISIENTSEIDIIKDTAEERRDSSANENIYIKEKSTVHKQQAAMKGQASIVLHKEDKIKAYSRETSGGTRNLSEDERAAKAQKLQILLKLMIEEVLREYDSNLKDDLKGEISEDLCENVKEAVIKEMDYQFRMQEEREEQRELERAKKDEGLLHKIEELLKTKKEEKKKTGFFHLNLKNVE